MFESTQSSTQALSSIQTNASPFHKTYYAWDAYTCARVHRPETCCWVQCCGCGQQNTTTGLPDVATPRLLSLPCRRGRGS